MTRAWSDEKIANVRKLYAEGMPANRIAVALKCNSATVRYYCRDMPMPVDGRKFNRGGSVGKYPAIQVAIDADFDDADGLPNLSIQDGE